MRVLIFFIVVIGLPIGLLLWNRRSPRNGGGTLTPDARTALAQSTDQPSAAQMHGNVTGGAGGPAGTGG
jgi:hypothetical protein